MPRNGSGTYTRTDGTYSGTDVYQQEQANGINIVASNLDATEQDMADAITASIAKDGQTTPTANLPMGGFKHTNCADPTADTDYVTRGYAKQYYRPGLTWVDGLKVTNNSTDSEHDIDIAVGRIMDSTNVYAIELESALTKRIDATFAVGTNQGGFSDQDTLSTQTWYGVFLISKAADPDDADVIFATTQANALADTVAAAAGFDIARLIGYVLTDGSSNIQNFTDGGRDLYLFNAQIDASAGASTSRTSQTVSAPPFQRAYLSVTFYITIIGSPVNQTSYALITNLSQTNTTPSSSSYHLMARQDAAEDLYCPSSLMMFIKTNGSSQIGTRTSNTANVVLDIFTMGWEMDWTVTDLV